MRKKYIYKIQNHKSSFFTKTGFLVGFTILGSLYDSVWGCYSLDLAGRV